MKGQSTNERFGKHRGEESDTLSKSMSQGIFNTNSSKLSLVSQHKQSQHQNTQQHPNNILSQERQSLLNHTNSEENDLKIKVAGKKEIQEEEEEDNEKLNTRK